MSPNHCTIHRVKKNKYMCLSLQYPQKNILLHLAKQRSFTGAAYSVYVKLSTRGNLILLQAVG